jgi:hypothetical protein
MLMSGETGCPVWNIPQLIQKTALKWRLTPVKRTGAYLGAGPPWVWEPGAAPPNWDRRPTGAEPPGRRAHSSAPRDFARYGETWPFGSGTRPATERHMTCAGVTEDNHQLLPDIRTHCESGAQHQPIYSYVLFNVPGSRMYRREVL